MKKTKINVKCELNVEKKTTKRQNISACDIMDPTWLYLI